MVAIAGDINKMYHSIKLKPGVDQHTHRFLWRELDTSRPPDTYILTSVSFGDRPAGAIATTALRKTAELGKNEYPVAANVILKSSYVDDLIDSFENKEEAQTVMKDIETLIEPGGFKIKEWTTNQIGCADTIPQETHTKSRNVIERLIDVKQQAGQKVLGMKWMAETDSLGFETKLNFSANYRKARTGKNLTANDVPLAIQLKLTKRQILC